MSVFKLRILASLAFSLSLATSANAQAVQPVNACDELDQTVRFLGYPEGSGLLGEKSGNAIFVKRPLMNGTLCGFEDLTQGQGVIVRKVTCYGKAWSKAQYEAKQDDLLTCVLKRGGRSIFNPVAFKDGPLASKSMTWDLSPATNVSVVASFWGENVAAVFEVIARIDESKAPSH